MLNKIIHFFQCKGGMFGTNPMSKHLAGNVNKSTIGFKKKVINFYYINNKNLCNLRMYNPCI